jgi:serine/threonine protein kinase
VSQEHQQALPLQQQPAGGGAGRQLVAGGAGVRGAAAGGSQQAGSSAAVAASGAADQAAAAEPVLGAVQVWGFGQVVVLTLMSLDTVPVRLGAYKLRVVRKLGSGGQGSVWLVELVGGDASGNSIAPGPASPPTAVAGGAGPSGVGSQAPAPSSNPSAAAAAAGAGPPGPAAAATYKPMPQLMAVKVGAPYHVASADRRAGLSQEQYEAHAKQLMANECNLVAKCGECKFIVDTYGWGTLHLSFPPLKQQQPPPGAAAAASGSSAGPIVVELPAMLLEFAEHGSVADQLRSCPPGTGLGERVVKSYLRDVLQALTHMHRFHDICYRDLKPENLLRFPVPPGPLKHRKPLDGQPQNQIYLVKVADLGIAEALTTTGAHYSSNKSYTPAYRAPEIAFTHDLRLDTFGVGCLLVALRSNQDPFFWLDKAPGLSEGEKEARRGAEELAREDCPYRQMLTPHELEFAATCLERDVAKRPYVSQLGLQASYHKYFFWK